MKSWVWRSRADCFRAFQLSHWLGLAVFLGLVLDYRYG